MATPSAPRDKYDHDPMVPIVPGRLKAALRHRGVTVKAAAAEIGKSQQTIDAIVNSAAPRRCRESIRDGLSSLLNCPPHWLSGHTDWLPDTVWTTQSQESGHPYLTDESFVFYRRNPDGTPELPLPQQDWDHQIPGHQLAAWELSEGILNAWKRDVVAGQEDAQKAWTELAGFSCFSDDGNHVGVAVQRLLALRWWERLITRDRSPKIYVMLPPADDSEPPEVAQARQQQVKELARTDTFATALSEGLEVLLEPWLSGSAPVDYDAITGVVRWVIGGMMSPAQRERMDAIMRSYDTGHSEPEPRDGIASGDPE